MPNQNNELCVSEHIESAILVVMVKLNCSLKASSDRHITAGMNFNQILMIGSAWYKTSSEPELIMNYKTCDISPNCRCGFFPSENWILHLFWWIYFLTRARVYGGGLAAIYLSLHARIRKSSLSLSDFIKTVTYFQLPIFNPITCFHLKAIYRLLVIGFSR